MATTMRITAAPPTSQFTPGPDCLESIFLTTVGGGRINRAERGCLSAAYTECPIYYLGLTDYYNYESSASCHPTETVLEGCPFGYTTACSESTVTPPTSNWRHGGLDWPVTRVEAICCPTNMQFGCTWIGSSPTCLAPVTQDTVVGLYIYTYYDRDPPAPITVPSDRIPFTATRTFGKQTLAEATTLSAGQDVVWAAAIGVAERVWGTSVSYVDFRDRWINPATADAPPPAAITQRNWAPGGSPRRTGIAALCTVLAVTVLFLASVFGFWRKRNALRKRRADRDIHRGNWTRGPPSTSGHAPSQTRLTDGALVERDIHRRNWTHGPPGSSSPVRS